MKSETRKTTEIGLPRGGSRRRLQQAGQQVQHVAAAAARRDHRVHPAAVAQQADPVAAPGQHARQQGDELGGDRLLAGAAGAEVDRGRHVDQEPGGQLAVLVELAHVRHLQPGGDVPVDVAHVVVVLVLAQVGEIEPGAAEQRPVVAVQRAVEPLQHGPLEPAQHRLRPAGRAARGFSRWRHERGSAAACRARRRASSPCR
jgi:hypothetical protein